MIRRRYEHLIHVNARLYEAAQIGRMDTSPEMPLCPNCAQPMVLARTWPRVGGLAEMLTFQCEPCNVVFTEVVTGDGAAPERVTVLHREEFHALH